MSDSPELLKPNAEVTEKGLQTEIGSLKAENEKLTADYDALLESSTIITNKLRQELAEVRSQLEAERADREQVNAELTEAKNQLAEWGSELERLHERHGDLVIQNFAWKEKLQNERAHKKDLPEAANLLNQLKSKRKKSKVDLVDVETLLEILEGVSDG